MGKIGKRLTKSSIIIFVLMGVTLLLLALSFVFQSTVRTVGASNDSNSNKLAHCNGAVLSDKYLAEFEYEAEEEMEVCGITLYLHASNNDGFINHDFGDGVINYYVYKNDVLVASNSISINELILPAASGELYANDFNFSRQSLCEGDVLRWIFTEDNIPEDTKVVIKGITSDKSPDDNMKEFSVTSVGNATKPLYKLIVPGKENPFYLLLIIVFVILSVLQVFVLFRGKHEED